MHTPARGLPAILFPGAFLMLAALAPAPARSQTPEQPPAGNGGAPDAPAAQNPPDTTTSDEDTDSERRPRPRFRIGPEIGIYVPTDSKTRSRFGDTWFNFGVGLGPIREVRTRGRLGLDLNILARKRGDNRVLLIPIGISYRRALTPTSTRPYVGASVNLYLADLRSPQDDVRSGMRAAGGGSVFTGLTLSDDGFIEARYQFVSEVRGFDLSGLNLKAGFRF